MLQEMKESLIDYLPGRVTHDFSETIQVARFIQFKKKSEGDFYPLEKIQVIEHKIYASQQEGIVLYVEYEIKSST